MAFKFTWNYIFNIAKNFKRELIFANIIAIVSTLIFVPLPLFMPLMVDEVLLHKPGNILAFMNQFIPETYQEPYFYITFLLISTIILRAISVLLNVWQTFLFTKISKEIVFRMRKTALNHIQSISMSEYENLGGGTVSSFLNTDVLTIDSFIGTSVSKLLISVLSLIGIAGVLLFLHWQLALVILIFNPIVIFFTMKLGKKVKSLKQNENKAIEIFQQSLVETLEAIQQIRASNRGAHYFGKLISQALTVKDKSIAFSWKSDTAGRFSFVIFLIGIEVFKAIAMLMVVYSNLSIGQMFAVFGYLWFMMGPVQELLNLQYSYFSAKGALQRINTLFGLKLEPVYKHEENPFVGKETVSVNLKNIHFSYNSDHSVLKGIDLKIEAGQKVAIVGASGGGKSTLVQVLLGLYPKQEGEIYFDGVPIEKIGLDVVRENVATVLQHPALLNDSIRLNLTLGLDFPDEKLWNSLKIAQLDEFVNGLSEKLDTIVGNHGVRLSGGQRQRLAIARMILSQPKMVVLDEATSALDQTTEKKLHEALNNYLKNKTTLIIAHRLSAVKAADLVYVFDDGVIIEKGDHDTLIHQDGLYSKLYK